ncbi:DUF3732 domain-containing protein [Pseudosulfitobacter sp. SM2401]|uniref:DUF3732 domain-containing protein n=1 Tax=Pseudosulfitobacter sp. SM2401 TaxID=3350098 RepID=UPI0036F2B9A1
MSRWNIVQVAFFGAGGRRRTLDVRPDNVTIVTGRSGTGKSAIIAAIDYCLGSKSCELPYFVRRRSVGVAVHWTNGEIDLLVGRIVPDEGQGTEKMFVRTGAGLQLPGTFDEMQGPAPRASARKMIERAFRIADIEDADTDEKWAVGKATVRHITPYLYLTADVIVSNSRLLHDFDDPDKVRDLKATMPYFLQAVDQETVLNQRKLRQLEAAYGRLERQQKSQQKSRSLVTERAIALLTQSSTVGLNDAPRSDATEPELLDLLRQVTSFDINRTDVELGDQLGPLEEERKQTVRLAATKRAERNALRALVKDSSGFETTVYGQHQKLGLVKHLSLDAGVCPVCQSPSEVGTEIAKNISSSLTIIEQEVASVQQVAPELIEQLEQAEVELKSTNSRIQEIERQIRATIQQNDTLKRAADVAQARAMTIGRVEQFLDTTVEDFRQPTVDLGNLRGQIEVLRDLVDPQALREKIAHAENMVSNYSSEMLAQLPSTQPLSGARMQFLADGKVKIIEAVRQRSLNMVEVGSDQNYLAIHLALLFGLHKHFEQVSSPVPGLLVIDQISRPYYPKDEKAKDERDLSEMKDDDDRRAMSQIVDFIFNETARASGLQVLLIEHAYMANDDRYVDATVERWTKENGQKLIPEDWPERGA